MVQVKRNRTWFGYTFFADQHGKTNMVYFTFFFQIIRLYFG